MPARISADGIDEKHWWVHISLDGHELEPHGPFGADEADAMAARFGVICRGVLHQPIHIGIVQQPAKRRA